MEVKNLLKINDIQEFRDWLTKNSRRENECWIFVKKGKNKPSDRIWYLDAVEQALCFGWIDTMHKNIDGVNMQRFTPRTKKSSWSELNKERCRRLEKIGQMTEAGRVVLPNLTTNNFQIDNDIAKRFNENPQAWDNFKNFPELYQRVRIDSIQRDKNKDREVFEKRLDKLITNSEQNEMFGDWNDYGRLLDY